MGRGKIKCASPSRRPRAPPMFHFPHFLSFRRRKLIPQCGFPSGRGTGDMVFAVRQLQGKWREQNQEIHLAYIDLTRLFNTVNAVGYGGYWRSLDYAGVRWIARTGFPVDNGIKQGSVIAPTLFWFLCVSACLWMYSVTSQTSLHVHPVPHKRKNV